MNQFRGWLAVVAICAVAATACEGGSASPSSGGSNGSAASDVIAARSQTPDERAAELADTLVSRMGDGTAVEALLFAVDAGYSAEQIEIGIRQAGLDEDGVVSSSAGEIVTPQGPAAGLILDDRATGSSAGVLPVEDSTLQLEPVAFRKFQEERLPISRLRAEVADIGATSRRQSCHATPDRLGLHRRPGDLRRSLPLRLLRHRDADLCC